MAIGLAAVAGAVVAHWTFARLWAPIAPVRALAAFVASFAAYQLALYAAAVSALGGSGAFVPSIVGQVLLVNAVALVGLYGLDQLVVAAGRSAARRRAQASAARFA